MSKFVAEEDEGTTMKYQKFTSKFLRDFQRILFLELHHTDDVNLNTLIFPRDVKYLKFIWKTKDPKQVVIPPQVTHLELVTNCPLNYFVLPKNLETLKVSGTKANTLFRLPENLRSLEISDPINLEISQNLERLSLLDDFNIPLSGLALPKKLKSLTLGSKFNHKLVNLPSGLQNLTVGDAFNQQIGEKELPDTLETLWLGAKFNSRLPKVLPRKLTNLVIGDGFNQPVNFAAENLNFLAIGKSFNQSLSEVTLPKIATVFLRSSFKKSLEIKTKQQYTVFVNGKLVE